MLDCFRLSLSVIRHFLSEWVVSSRAWGFWSTTYPKHWRRIEKEVGEQIKSHSKLSVHLIASLKFVSIKTIVYTRILSNSRWIWWKNTKFFRPMLTLMMYLTSINHYCVCETIINITFFYTFSLNYNIQFHHIIITLSLKYWL